LIALLVKEMFLNKSRQPTNEWGEKKIAEMCQNLQKYIFYNYL